jgi:uroporphyrinogen-III synthase
MQSPNLITETSGLDGWWIVFFAPSAAAFVMPTLTKFFDLEPTGSNGSTRSHVAAIGQTTAAFLHDNLNIRVNVIPPKPTPEDIVAAIVQYDGRNPHVDAIKTG